MSIIPLLCLVLVACVCAQNRNKFNFKGGRWNTIFEHTGGLSANFGANYRKNGHNIGGYLHGNLRNPGRKIDGLGFRGSYDLGKGMRIGGNIHHNFGGGTGGGIFFSKSFGKRRSTVCMSRCAYACRTSTVKCMKNCLVNMC
ncbi:uncharacterized protein LOC134701218 [Mytilus trossulus]|uniref:uncharacterized protein LOC134701218 n=1 Tax=Mytilus trossulus TaxID=6551 RepID=UPI0030058DFF